MAKLWVDAGHEVRLSSRHPEDLQGLVKRLGKGASAGTPVEAGVFGEVIMMTVPLASVPDLARDLGPLLSNKVVLDTGNAYEKRDGEVAHLATGHPEGSAAWAAAMFPGARWVKAFSTVYFKVLASEAHRTGDQIGIPLAGDDPEAVETAARLVRHAGFDRQQPTRSHRNPGGGANLRRQRRAGFGHRQRWSRQR
jgi:8-hydroxy-5-deazaflavin:NADPH oxidoreductase